MQYVETIVETRSKLGLRNARGECVGRVTIVCVRNACAYGTYENVWGVRQLFVYVMSVSGICESVWGVWRLLVYVMPVHVT